MFSIGLRQTPLLLPFNCSKSRSATTGSSEERIDGYLVVPWCAQAPNFNGILDGGVRVGAVMAVNRCHDNAEVLGFGGERAVRILTRPADPSCLHLPYSPGYLANCAILNSTLPLQSFTHCVSMDSGSCIPMLFHAAVGIFTSVLLPALGSNRLSAQLRLPINEPLQPAHPVSYGVQKLKCEKRSIT